MQKINFKYTRIFIIFISLFIFLIFSIYMSLRFGAMNISNNELFNAVKHPLISSTTQNIIINIRLPRTIAAIFVGAALSVSGNITQALLKNPIADSSVLGINSGAALGLTIAYSIFHGLHYFSILIACLIGSVITIIILFLISRLEGQGNLTLRILLTGIMLASLFNTLGQLLVITFNLSTTIIGWQAGGLININWKMLTFILPFLLIGLAITFTLSYQLNILSLNHTLSKSLGQNSKKIMSIFIVLTLILSSSSVALAGSIPFIGLVIPHLFKKCFNQDFRLKLPISALLGAIFLVWVDLISRTIHPPVETSLGAIVSIIGFPFFILLVRRELK